MSILNKLTEGITERSLRKEGATLVNKWARTGLLEGLGNDNKQNNMARLLENQAKELLREATTMASYVFQSVLIRLWLPPPEKPPQLQLIISAPCCAAVNIPL